MVFASFMGSLVRVGVTPGLSRVDSGRVVLLNSLALVVAAGSFAGLFTASTWREPVYVLTTVVPVLGGPGIFLLHARGLHGSAAAVFLGIGFLVALAPAIFVSPWAEHVYFLIPLAALPWLLVTSQRFWIALALSTLATAFYVAIVYAYALTFDMRAAQRLIGEFAIYSPAIVAVVMALIGQSMRRITVAAELALERERLQSGRLVQAMLPVEVADAVLAGAAPPAQRHGDASVLFCGIDDFDRIGGEEDDEALVGLLDDLFSAFDRLCSEGGVEKIKSYGEHYLVVAGVPNHRPDHAERLAALALEMHRVTIGRCTSRGTPIRLRIGINSGPLVAGVIGHTQLSYDIWGDAVNLAQRMEAHGEPGETQVSPITFAKINHRFICQPRAPLAIKGREPMKTYWLRGKRAR